MGKIARTISAICAFIFLTGLSSTFDISIDLTTPQGPYFRLERRKVLGVNQKHIELNNFSVFEKVGGEWDYKNPLWAFSLKPGNAIEIGEIQYGKTPTGFVETVEAKPLKPGRQYQAFGAVPGASGAAIFSLNGSP